MVQVERLADDATLIDDMRLPQGEDLDYLIDGLGNLIRRRGIEPLLLNPILLPEPRYFPDAFAPGPVGARRLLRRLLHYAALDYVVRLYVYDRFAPTQLGATFIVPEGAHTGAAAWYAGHEAGEAHFGVARNELRDVDELIGTLGHEVAHLYRDHHRLVVRDAAIEELLTDLTTVYLGFGVFLLLSSFSFKTGGYDEQGNPLSYQRQVRGYLSLGELATLLAAQLVLRGSNSQQRKAILRALPANQASLVGRAYKQLSSEREWLMDRLELANSDLLPASELPPSLGASGVPTASIPEENDAEFIEEAWEDGEPLDDEEDAQPRASDVRHVPTRLAPTLALPCVGTLMLALVGSYFGWVQAIVLGLVGMGIGAFLRTRDERYACVSCGAQVLQDKDWCPGCDAPVAWPE